MTNFFEFSEKETFVPSEAVDTLNNFILSTNAGLMMIGPSGSGKTTVLKYWANFNNNRSENTIIPFVGREHRLIQVGTQVFSNWLNEDEKIKTINDLFYCRKQRLILIYDAVNEACQRNLLIMGFENTLHQRDLLIEECIFLPEEHEKMALTIRNLIHNVALMQELLTVQQKKREDVWKELLKTGE